MQFRTGRKSGVAVAAMIAVLGLFGMTMAGGITSLTHYIVDDSTETTTFYIGSSAAKADFDTSIVYDARHWEDLTIGVKARPIATVGSADSGAVTVVLQMSNDSIYWTPIDSIVVVDSLPAFKDLTPQKFAWARFIWHHGAKSDSAGVQGQGIIRNWGRY